MENLPMDIELSERKRNLLNAIIKDYVVHSEPLGSRTICKRHGFSLSPATIRNEMAELEECGLLYQPHTSAGRVPSDKGYRFFVNHLMDRYIPTPEEQQFLLRLKQTSKAIDAVLSQAIQILSEATKSFAVAEAPHLRSNPVKTLQMMPVDEMSMVLSLTYSSGLKRQSLIQLSQPIYSEILTLMTNYINAQLNNTPLDQLFHQIVTGPLEREIQYYKSIVLEMVSEIYSQAQRDEKVYATGTSQLLKEPEFQQIEIAYPIMQFLENESFVKQLLHSSNNVVTEFQDLYCLIGDEHPYQELHNCSFVSSNYYIDKRASGRIGILGPTRMNYPKVMVILQAVANNVTQVLTKLFS